MVRFGDDPHRRLRLKLLAPYAAVFALISLVGYQASTYIFAESTPSQVSLSLEQTSYAVNEPIRFTILNNSDRAVSVLNNCPGEPLEVYRQQDAQWLRIHQNADPSKCVGAPRHYTIAPQSKVSATYNFWPSLFEEPGRYRIVAPIEPGGERPLAEFDVRP